MVDEIIKQYTKIKELVAAFIARGKTDEEGFIEEMKLAVKEFSELLEKPEEKPE